MASRGLNFSSRDVLPLNKSVYVLVQLVPLFSRRTAHRQKPEKHRTTLFPGVSLTTELTE